MFGQIGREFVELGFNIVATTGTHKELEKAGVDAKRALKIS